MAAPVLLYEVKRGPSLKKTRKQNTILAIKILKPVKGCTRIDPIRNHDIRNELRIDKMKENIIDHRNKSRKYAERIFLNYRPVGECV